MLRTLAESNKPKWHEHIDKLVSAYNATEHSTTGFSPFFLMFGRQPILPLDLVLTSHARQKENVGRQYQKFVDEWEERMTEAYTIAKEKCSKVKKYDEAKWKKRKIANKLQVGDRVLVRNKRENTGPGKLRAYWENDIFVVKECKDDVVYSVQNMSRGNDLRILHRNMLLQCDMLEEPVEQPPERPHVNVQKKKPARQRSNPNGGESDSSSDEEIELVQWPKKPEEINLNGDTGEVSSNDQQNEEHNDGNNHVNDNAGQNEDDDSNQQNGESNDDNEHHSDDEDNVENHNNQLDEEHDDKEHNEDNNGDEVNNEQPVRRVLRSQGRTLEWNSEMGAGDVVVESNEVSLANRLRNCRQQVNECLDLVL